MKYLKITIKVDFYKSRKRNWSWPPLHFFRGGPEEFTNTLTFCRRRRILASSWKKSCIRPWQFNIPLNLVNVTVKAMFLHLIYYTSFNYYETDIVGGVNNNNTANIRTFFSYICSPHMENMDPFSTCYRNVSLFNLR